MYLNMLGDNEEPEDTVFDNKGQVSRSGIVGGKFVDIKTVPYLAQIISFGDLTCGASIISKEWLLTAAHCVERINPDYESDYGERSIYVRTGSTIRGKGELFEVAKIIVHEHFNSITMDNDIALIKTAETIEFDDQQKPISISDLIPKPGDEIEVAGFGKEGEDKPKPKTLKAAVLPVIDSTDCNTKYKKVYPYQRVIITDNMFCSFKKGEDTCHGDSGGPAVIDNQLVGIISWGYDCGASGLPGVYTLLRNYRKWISNHTAYPMLCARKDKDDTCEGDSGGSAVINGKLVGIVSWGFDCAASKLPSVYTLAKNYHE
ncbi:hypothetical protein TSAR_009465 [Trichomalopsis sarcophagae]|uniref:Peptidase S1 domain-containing protein n=1 Tax=Trichomalopsis sarcophagae TaxID=543379 RepID=A0A232FN53_9HYME|nr:hypothetical protein TSAR_009465 [Trichomalopsis sarcophagae]